MSACSSLRIRFFTRCLITGSTGVSANRGTKSLKSFCLSRVAMWKVLEKITIFSKKFDMYMVSRFDWSISILFFIGGYVCFDQCKSWKVSHRVEIMYFFIFYFLNYLNFFYFFLFFIFEFSNFLWRQFRGMETCPYMAYGRGLPIYGSLHPPQVFGVHKTEHSLLLWIVNHIFVDKTVGIILLKETPFCSTF